MSYKLIERAPFWGSKTPNELLYLQKVLSNKISNINLTKNCYREILKIILISIEELNNQESLDKINVKLKQLSNQFKINSYQMFNIYTSILKLFNQAIRLSTIKQDIIKEDLIEILKFPNDFVSDFTSVLYSHKRESIELSLMKSYPKYFEIKNLNWRIDISISSSSISRGLVPTIIFQITLSNNKIISFEMNLQTFHYLRFNVALVLKEMDDLLNKQIFKLSD